MTTNVQRPEVAVPSDLETLSAQDLRALGSPVAAVANLRTVGTPVLSAEIVSDEGWTAPLVAHTSISGSTMRTVDGARTHLTYDVTGVQVAGELDTAIQGFDLPEGKVIWRARVSVLVEYTCPDPGSFTDAQIDAFCRVYGAITAHPYARAQLTYLTAAIGVPTLVLESLHIPG